MSQQDLTAERLRSLLSYDRETGLFTRIAKNNRRHVVGEICGYRMSSGYISISVDGVAHLAHRLAYLHEEGRHPAEQIDHCDLNKSNNSWANLREATATQQSHNVAARSTNKCGYKGVSKDRRRNRFCAYISTNGKAKFLGSRATPEEAHALYCAAASATCGEFARFS